MAVIALLFEHKIYGADEEEKGHEIIPAQGFFQEGNREDAENSQGNYFLDGFQLKPAEAFLHTIAIGWYHKTVLKKGNAPADQDDLPERYILMFQVPIPGESHKGVGNGKQNDGTHEYI